MSVTPKDCFQSSENVDAEMLSTPTYTLFTDSARSQTLREKGVSKISTGIAWPGFQMTPNSHLLLSGPLHTAPSKRRLQDVNQIFQFYG